MRESNGFDCLSNLAISTRMLPSPPCEHDHLYPSQVKHEQQCLSNRTKVYGPPTPCYAMISEASLFHACTNENFQNNIIHRPNVYDPFLPIPMSALVCRLRLPSGFSPLPGLMPGVPDPAPACAYNLLCTEPGVCVGVEFDEDGLFSSAVVVLFSRFFVPARLNLVIRVPALVLGNRLLFAALLAEATDDGGPEDDGVLLLHNAPLDDSILDVGSGGGRSELVMMGPLPPSEFPLNPLSLVRSPLEPSRLIGRNCPGVKLPLTPKDARLDELPKRSLLAAAALLDSNNSVLLRSKYEDFASLKCRGVPLSTGILWLLRRLGGGGIELGVMFAVLELARLRPARTRGAAPSKVRLEPTSHALRSSLAISRTKIAGSDSFSRSMASCSP